MLIALQAIAAWLFMSCATAAAESIVIGVEDMPYPPMHFVEQGEFRGFARDLLDAFAESADLSVTYRIVPFSRLLNLNQERKIDLQFADNPYWAPERKNGLPVHYSDPIIGYTDGVYVAPQFLGQGIGHIRVLGTVVAFTPYRWLDRIREGKVQLTENPSLTGLIRQGLAGRVDGVYANVDVVRQLLHDMGRDGALVYDPSLPHTTSAYHVSSIKRPDLVERFDQWMRDDSATVARLAAKYGLKITAPQGSP